MGTRTMGSHGRSDGLTKTKLGDLYNLTLDEVQQQLGDLGKPLSSMNIDELIKSVSTARSTEQPNNGIGMPNPNTQLPSASSLLDLSKKTVDELWQDMNKEVSGSNDHNLDGETETTRAEKQPTLGEMTLEDFLAKAGIVEEEKNKSSPLGTQSGALPQQNVSSQLTQWIQYQIAPFQQQQHMFMPGHHPPQQIIGDVAYPETPMTVSSDTQTPGRKRVASGDLREKTVERRQKRMIKNRESAARSRARKQAYTNELENKVSHLEEENVRLKSEQEAENALPCIPPPEPRYQLRRTSSASF